MLHFLAEIDINQVMDHSRPLGERLVQGLQTLGLGLGIVFAVLIIIWGACELLHFLVHGATKKEAPVSAPATAKPATAPVAAPAPTAPTQADNSELIAVITAAVAAMLDQPTTAFRVVSFRRTGDKGRAWNNGHAE